jgi:DNA-binding NtrC family response regulator
MDPVADTHPLAGRRVVVVDDDSPLLEAVTGVLKEAGCAVAAFGRFQDAKQHLATKDPPDVLITDVRLGAFNGLQLALKCKLEHPSMVAVVMTGFDDPVLRRDAETSGAHYLLKPVRPDTLIDLLRLTATRPEPSPSER